MQNKREYTNRQIYSQISCLQTTKTSPLNSFSKTFIFHKSHKSHTQKCLIFPERSRGAKIPIIHAIKVRNILYISIYRYYLK